MDFPYQSGNRIHGDAGLSVVELVQDSERFPI